ncbi:hypothetical protein FCR2A7T_20130 [Flavobacterium cauense R2A-7]|nr:hypothetical protein FCR2A7T_20130 [Flavobacterium cauense R2A-7]
MLTNSECKKILNKNENLYNDEEVELLKETLYRLVEITEKSKTKK